MLLCVCFDVIIRFVSKIPAGDSPLEGTKTGAFKATSITDQVPHTTVRLTINICQYTHIYVLRFRRWVPERVTRGVTYREPQRTRGMPHQLRTMCRMTVRLAIYV